MLIKCKQWGLHVPAGIYRLKLHIAGIRGQVNMESLILIEVALLDFLVAQFATGLQSI